MKGAAGRAGEEGCRSASSSSLERSLPALKWQRARTARASLSTQPIAVQVAQQYRPAQGEAGKPRGLQIS